LQICLDMASYNVVESDLEYFTNLVNNHVNIVFANEEESRAFTRLAPCEALHEMAAHCDVAVVKLGAKGSIAARKRGTCNEIETAFCAAGVPAKVIDTTAAGDFFAAGFLHALTRNCTLEACLAVGTILSTEIIQVVGTVLSEHTWNNIRCRVNDICN